LIYYYQKRDGSILSTIDIDPFLSNSDDIRRVFRKEGDVLKCIHDNDAYPWGYLLDASESTEIVLKASDPSFTEHLHIKGDLDDI